LGTNAMQYNVYMGILAPLASKTVDEVIAFDPFAEFIRNVIPHKYEPERRIVYGCTYTAYPQLFQCVTLAGGTERQHVFVNSRVIDQASRAILFSADKQRQMVDVRNTHLQRLECSYDEMSALRRIERMGMSLRLVSAFTERALDEAISKRWNERFPSQNTTHRYPDTNIRDIDARTARMKEAMEARTETEINQLSDAMSSTIERIRVPQEGEEEDDDGEEPGCANAFFNIVLQHRQVIGRKRSR